MEKFSQHKKYLIVVAVAVVMVVAGIGTVALFQVMSSAGPAPAPEVTVIYDTTLVNVSVSITNARYFHASSLKTQYRLRYVQTDKGLEYQAQEVSMKGEQLSLAGNANAVPFTSIDQYIVNYSNKISPAEAPNEIGEVLFVGFKDYYSKAVLSPVRSYVLGQLPDNESISPDDLIVNYDQIKSIKVTVNLDLHGRTLQYAGMALGSTVLTNSDPEFKDFTDTVAANIDITAPARTQSSFTFDLGKDIYAKAVESYVHKDLVTVFNGKTPQFWVYTYFVFS